jgi:hypothetical protein
MVDETAALSLGVSRVSGRFTMGDLHRIAGVV